MNKMIDVVHDTIYQFFDVCGDDEEAPMSDKDKLLLEVNKAICNNLKALEQEPKIIRCKDCKQFRRWVDTDITFCDLTESPVFETDFCSRAESEDKV